MKIEVQKLEIYKNLIGKSYARNVITNIKNKLYNFIKLQME
jgi:hypothetical protein